MGRKAIAVAIVVTLLVASLALAIIPFTNNGGNTSPVKYTETGEQELDTVTTETIDKEFKDVTSVEPAYVSDDGILYAYLTGTANLPVVTVVGDTHSSELAKIGTPTMDEYFAWVTENITHGINLRQDYNFGCSCFEVDTENGHFVGRNQDYAGDTRCPLVFRCIPTNGYASIGVTYKALLFDDNASMESLMGSSILAAAPFAALDGMNEKGLTCSILTTPYDSQYQSKTGSLFAIGMLRYVLDFADSVETAKTLITNVGYSSLFGGSTLHLFLTDKDGNSVAVEVIGGKLVFTETDYITNHYISPQVATPSSSDNSVVRLNTMKDMLDGKTDVTLDLCKETLKAVSGGGTTYSIVFDVDNLTVNVWYNLKYDVDPVIYDINQLVAVKCEEDMDETIDDEGTVPAE